MNQHPKISLATLAHLVAGFKALETRQASGHSLETFCQLSPWYWPTLTAICCLGLTCLVLAVR
jgi:hypothetical protein